MRQQVLESLLRQRSSNTEQLAERGETPGDGLGNVNGRGKTVVDPHTKVP